MSNFNETQHPRGKAGNAGQFREKANSAPTGGLAPEPSQEPAIELTGHTKDVYGSRGYVTVHEVRATRDIPEAGVKAGDVGGHVESLTLRDGTPRIKDNAWLGAGAVMLDQSTLADNAAVTGDAWLAGKARVAGNAKITAIETINRGHSVQVFDNAVIDGDASVTKGMFSEHGHVTGTARIAHGSVFGRAVVSGGVLAGKAAAYDRARVEGGYIYAASIHDKAVVRDNADVSGDGFVGGTIVLAGDIRWNSNTGTEMGR